MLTGTKEKRQKTEIHYMQYKTGRLIKSYAGEAMEQARIKTGAASMRVKKEALRVKAWLILTWNESMLKSYLSLLAADTSRNLALTGKRGYLGAALTLCCIMSLGFVVINPPQPKPKHYARVNMFRPNVTSVSQQSAPEKPYISPYELAAAYESHTGMPSVWFGSGTLDMGAGNKPGGITGKNARQAAGTQNGNSSWASSRSPLALDNGQIIIRKASGAKRIDALGAVSISADSTTRPTRNLSGFVSGVSSPEELLAELGVQSLAPGKIPRVYGGRVQHAEPGWGSGNYGTEVFEGPKVHWSGQYLAENGSGERLCKLDRMEQASWFNMLYASHSKNSIYNAKKAAHYRKFVEQYAGQYSLQPSLVYAIMRVESGFNPLAISKANALGLMQVVPATAGNEVHAFLRGKKADPSADLLFTPESNIQYGTAYLHLLTTRHFNGIKNPVSRELCIIAAYNAGPNSVYRVFSRDKGKAVAAINKLTPEQLYTKLVTGLASQETRDYLPRVLGARNDFLRGHSKFN